MHEENANLTSTPPETKPGSAQRSKLGRSFDIMNQLFNSAHGHMLTDRIKSMKARSLSDCPNMESALSVRLS